MVVVVELVKAGKLVALGEVADPRIGMASTAKPAQAMAVPAARPELAAMVEPEAMAVMVAQSSMVGRMPQ